MMSALRDCLPLAASLMACQVWACSTTSLHQQIALLGKFGSQPMPLPQEVVLHAGDLISILMPHHSDAQAVDTNGHQTHALQAIPADRYEALRHRKDVKTPVEISDVSYPSHLAWRHFSANQTETVYLKLTAGLEHALLRLSIANRPVAPEGRDWVKGKADQQDTIALSPFDTLTLKLPGELGDAWQVKIGDQPVALMSISRDVTHTDISTSQVLLQMKAAALLSGASPRRLTVRHAEKETYHFTVLPRPTPAC